MKTHRFSVRVYYEDTDLAGIVYYANYLRFIEGARSEMLRELGVDQKHMKEAGVVFSVRRLEADYVRAAKYDDLLDVETELNAIKGASITLNQRVMRGGDLVFDAVVTIACIAQSGKPTRIPADIRQKLLILM
jgi:acyl-CoA thioester hydrolase